MKENARSRLVSTVLKTKRNVAVPWMSPYVHVNGVEMKCNSFIYEFILQRECWWIWGQECRRELPFKEDSYFAFRLRVIAQFFQLCWHLHCSRINSCCVTMEVFWIAPKKDVGLSSPLLTQMYLLSKWLSVMYTDHDKFIFKGRCHNGYFSLLL